MVVLEVLSLGAGQVNWLVMVQTVLQLVSAGELDGGGNELDLKL